MQLLLGRQKAGRIAGILHSFRQALTLFFRSFSGSPNSKVANICRIVIRSKSFNLEVGHHYRETSRQLTFLSRHPRCT